MMNGIWGGRLFIRSSSFYHGLSFLGNDLSVSLFTGYNLEILYMDAELFYNGPAGILTLNILTYSCADLSFDVTIGA